MCEGSNPGLVPADEGPRPFSVSLFLPLDGFLTTVLFPTNGSRETRELRRFLE